MIASDIISRFSALKNNTRNALNYYDRAGVRKSKTYAEVYRDVLDLTSMLREKKILQENSNVVVCGDMGYEWLVSAMSCIISNCTLIALPETLKQEEYLSTLEGVPFSGILSDNEALLACSFSEKKYYSLMNVERFLGETSTRSAKVIEASNIALVAAEGLIAFTSGSTASKRLKAFDVSLASSLAFSQRFVDLYAIGSTDSWLICHTFSHIVHFEYALGGLLVGYDVTLCSVIHLLMQGEMLRPSVVVTVPSVYDKLAEQIERQYSFEPGGEKQLAALRETDVVDSRGNIQRQDLSESAQKVLGDRIKMMLIGASPSPTELQRFLLQNGVPLYEGYGMSEVNMISCNQPSLSRLCTTGPAWPGIEVKLDDNENVLVRTTPQRSKGYLNALEDENAETFIGEGWINTGDIGCLDEDGCLRIIGRSKDTIVSSGGKNINPSAIETKLSGIPGVSHAVVYGDNQPYLVAVLSSGKASTDIDKRTVANAIDLINSNLPSHEKVLNFFILDRELNEKEGTLTRSGKPRRKNVISHYENEILALYA